MATQFKSQTKANKLIITTLPENQKFKNFWACMYDFRRNIPHHRSQKAPQVCSHQHCKGQKTEQGETRLGPCGLDLEPSHWLPLWSVYQSELQVRPKPKVGGREQSSPLDYKCKFTWQRAQVQEGIRNI